MVVDYTKSKTELSPQEQAQRKKVKILGWVITELSVLLIALGIVFIATDWIFDKDDEIKHILGGMLVFIGIVDFLLFHLFLKKRILNNKL